MAKLIFDHNGDEIELEDDSPIAEACEEAGVPFACTEGVCGTCVIEVKEGKEYLTPPTQEEEDFLGEKAAAKKGLLASAKLKMEMFAFLFKGMTVII